MTDLLLDLFKDALLLIFIVIGIILWWDMLSSMSKAIRANKWPVVYATVNHVELEKDDSGSGPTAFAAMVEYAYSVGATVYEGSTLSFGYNATSAARAHEQIYEKLKSAKIIEARYNPGNHAESCLTAGITGSHLISLSYVVMWTGIAIDILGIRYMNTFYASSLILIFTGFFSSFLLFALNDYMLLRKMNVIQKVDDI